MRVELGRGAEHGRAGEHSRDVDDDVVAGVRVVADPGVAQLRDRQVGDGVLEHRRVEGRGVGSQRRRRVGGDEAGAVGAGRGHVGHQRARSGERVRQLDAAAWPCPRRGLARVEHTLRADRHEQAVARSRPRSGPVNQPRKSTTTWPPPCEYSVTPDAETGMIVVAATACPEPFVLRNEVTCSGVPAGRADRKPGDVSPTLVTLIGERRGVGRHAGGKRHRELAAGRQRAGRRTRLTRVEQPARGNRQKAPRAGRGGGDECSGDVDDQVAGDVLVELDRAGRPEPDDRRVGDRPVGSSVEHRDERPRRVAGEERDEAGAGRLAWR